MRIALVSSVLLLLSAPAAFAGTEEGPLYDSVMLIKDAFTAEGTFDTDARENLLGAHDLLTGIIDGGEYTDEEYIAVMSLQSLVKYNMACLDAIEGDLEGAFVWLDGAVSAGYTDAEWMAEDPDLEPLHGDVRFEHLLQEAYEIQSEIGACWGVSSHSCTGDCCSSCPGSDESCCGASSSASCH